MSTLFATPRTMKCFDCDLNWTKFDRPVPATPPAMAADWAQVSAREYFDWHVDIGNNVMFCQAYLFGGTALYPSKLGPVACGKGADLLPELYALSRAANMPFVSYFCVGTDLTVAALRSPWVVPANEQPPGALQVGFPFLAPESPWTELLCARIAEFLSQYPVEWILFDWFGYGSTYADAFRVQPAWFVKEPFQEIVGRPMPERTDGIAPAENLLYKREILTRQFRAIEKTVRQTSPGTKTMYNVPYMKPAEPLWVDHPMLLDSDSLFAECTRSDVVEWLLRVRKPNQRVMTTLTGHQGQCDPETWRQWHERGLDFFGYAWGTPPDFKPHPSFAPDLAVVRRAFHAIG